MQTKDNETYAQKIDRLSKTFALAFYLDAPKVPIDRQDLQWLLQQTDRYGIIMGETPPRVVGDRC